MLREFFKRRSIDQLKREIARIEEYIERNRNSMTEKELNDLLEVLYEKYNLLRALEDS